MKSKAKEYNKEAYDREYEFLTSQSTGITNFNVARLQHLKDLIESHLNPEGKIKITTSLPKFNELAKKVNAFIDQKLGENKVRGSWLRNIYFYEKHVDFRRLSESEKLKKGVPKNSNIAKGVERFLMHYVKNIFLPDWYPNTSRSETPQKSDYLILPLQGRKLRRLTCWIKSNSKYYRFGVKFIGDATFGDKTIESLDKNILVHVGRGSMYDLTRIDLFTAIFLNGSRVMKEEKISQDHFTQIIHENNDPYKLDVFIDNDDFLHFAINDKPCESVVIEKLIQNKVYLFSWADGVAYDIFIKDIVIEINYD